MRYQSSTGLSQAWNSIREYYIILSPSVLKEPSLTNMASADVRNGSVMHVVYVLVILGILGIDVTNSAAVNLDLQLQHQPAPLPDGYIRYSDIGVAYKVYEQYATWIEAMRKCEQDYAQLALIDSFEKIRHVTNQRRSPGSTYVGIIRMLDDTIWMGVATGSAVSSSSLPWAPGEPWGEQDCVMISGDGSGLVNNSCDVKSSYVCEISIDANNENTTDYPEMFVN